MLYNGFYLQKICFSYLPNIHFYSDHDSFVWFYISCISLKQCQIHAVMLKLCITSMCLELKFDINRIWINLPFEKYPSTMITIFSVFGDHHHHQVSITYWMSYSVLYCYFYIRYWLFIQGSDHHITVSSKVPQQAYHKWDIPVVQVHSGKLFIPLHLIIGGYTSPLPWTWKRRCDVSAVNWYGF